jgi:hypothetical protein
VLFHCGGEAKPADRDDYADGPTQLAGIIAREKNGQDDDGGYARGESEKLKPGFVTE